MSYKPLVSKIRVYHPNKKGSSIANRNYVTYIATREGVSLEKINEIQDVNDLLKIQGMDNAEIKESLVHQEAENEQYVRYMANRPRSQGLFGNIDTSDLKKVSSEVAKLTDSGKVIYRGIISLSERDGEELGFRNVNAWNNYLKQVMPDVADALGISNTNYTWIAAFHAEESHPHVHYMLWENRDRVKSPYIHVATQQKIRILLENEMFNNEYERTVKQIISEEYKDELDELKQIRTSEREKMVEYTKNIMSDVTFVPGLEYERLPQRIPKEFFDAITDEVQKLIVILPEHGRLNYKFLPPDVKDQVDKITDMLLQRPDMQSSLEKYLASVEQMQGYFGKTKTKIQSEKNIAEKDVRKRIANRILKEIKAAVKMPQVTADIKLDENFSEEERKTEIPEGDNMYSPFEKFSILQPQYYIEWNDAYNTAMEMLYAKEPKVEEAFDLIETEAIRGNALAINEAGKIIERMLVSGDLEEAKAYFNEAEKAFLQIYKNMGDSKEQTYIKSYAAYRLGKLYNMGKGDLEVDYEKAAQWYRKAEDNKWAQYSLGKLYLEDKIDVTDTEDAKKIAFNLFRRAVSYKKPNPYAFYELGKMYENGVGVKMDQVQSQVYYKSALDNFLMLVEKNTDDMLFYRIGKMYMEGKGTEINEANAIKYIKKAADLNNSAAQISLATIYMNQQDVVLQKKALSILEEVSAKKETMAQFAQYKLGMLYLDGERYPEHYDVTKAIECLKASADQGNQFAQYKLGMLHLDGERYPEHYDVMKALEYLKASADQGNQFVQYKLGMLYLDGERYPEYYDVTKALEYLKASADQGNQFAQYKLGMLHLDGERYPEHYDVTKALEYLKASANQGNQFAQYKLGMLHLDGERYPEYYDVTKALGYLKASADQGNQFAQYRLGMLHLDEERYPEHYNVTKALGYLKASADQGNQFAQCKLGCLFYFGKKDVLCDRELGRYWLQLAAEQGNEMANDILNNQMVGMDFSYCLLKGALGAMEAMNRQSTAQNEQLSRTHSRQAMKEKNMHKDHSHGMEEKEYL